MATFHYRRRLEREDWAKVVGAGVGAGAAVALVVIYFARIFAQRTPVRSYDADPAPDRAARGAPD